MSEIQKIEKTTFGGGCFWCLEAVFKRLKGVKAVESGYTGGKISNPTYKEVCSGLTGHAEVVQITYDSAIVDFNTLLKVFFSMHDPSTLNRQGADIGTQYRSAIFYHNDSQKAESEKFMEQLRTERVFEKITTELSPLGDFYPAEDYHKDYYDLNREKNSYCVAVIDPKVSKLRKSYAHLLQD